MVLAGAPVPAALDVETARARVLRVSFLLLYTGYLALARGDANLN